MEASANGGPQAAQSTVTSINSKADATASVINNLLSCNPLRQFYAPSDPKKDASGCVGTPDFSLNMGSASNVGLTNAQIAAGGSLDGSYLGSNVNASSSGYVFRRSWIRPRPLQQER